jgi:hypothetical protein
MEMPGQVWVEINSVGAVLLIGRHARVFRVKSSWALWRGQQVRRRPLSSASACAIETYRAANGFVAAEQTSSLRTGQTEASTAERPYQWMRGPVEVGRTAAALFGVMSEVQYRLGRHGLHASVVPRPLRQHRTTCGPFALSDGIRNPTAKEQTPRRAANAAFRGVGHSFGATVESLTGSSPEPNTASRRA